MNSYWSLHNILFITYSDYPFSYTISMKKIKYFIFLPILHKPFPVTLEICNTSHGPVQTINFSCCTFWTKKCVYFPVQFLGILPVR